MKTFPQPIGFNYDPAPKAYYAQHKNNTWKGELIDYGTLALSPGSAALNYGPAIFEGLKARRTPDNQIVLFRPDKNAERMIAGAERLCMKAPSRKLFTNAVSQVVSANTDSIPNSGEGDLYIRPILFGSEGVLGLQSGNEFTFHVWANPVGPYFTSGLTPGKFMIITDAYRAVQGGTGNIKAAGNYASALKYSKLAKSQGYNEVIWTDAKTGTCVEEVGAANLFYLKKNTLFTPELSGTILPGVTRDSVIQLAKHLNIEVVEEAILIGDFLQADEAFCTGTAAGIAPIGTVQHEGKDVVFNNEKLGNITQQLYTALTDIQYGQAEDVFGWNMTIA